VESWRWGVLRKLCQQSKPSQQSQPTYPSDFFSIQQHINGFGQPILPGLWPFGLIDPLYVFFSVGVGKFVETSLGFGV